MIAFKFEGGEDIARALAQLETRLSKRLLMETLKEAAEPIRKAAAAHAPRDDQPPHIADNIGVSAERSEDEAMAAVKIGPVKGFAYGVPLEIGTIDTQAQPFMRPAFDANIQTTLNLVSAIVWRELAGRGINRPTATGGSVEAPDRGDVV